MQRAVDLKNEGSYANDEILSTGGSTPTSQNPVRIEARLTGELKMGGF